MSARNEVEPYNKGRTHRFAPTQAVSGDIPLFEVEKAAVLKTLESSDGNRSEAARRLGITRKTLLKKLKQYGVAK